MKSQTPQQRYISKGKRIDLFFNEKDIKKLGFVPECKEVKAAFMNTIYELQTKIEELESDLQEERYKCNHCTQGAYRYNG